MPRHIPALTSLVLLTVVPMLRGQSADDAAKKARAVFVANCHRCHGKDGAVEGGFSYILDRQQLIARKQVVAGDGGKSRLLRRLERGEMPPEGENPRPTKEDIALVKRWIELGAPDFNPPVAARKFITTEDMLQAMHEDAKTYHENDRKFIRYVTLTHLYNAGRSEDELQSFRHGVAKLVNSLSWGRRIVPPAAIDPARTILRVDLRDYKWTASIWDKLSLQDPYALTHNTNATAKALYAGCGCAVPYVRGDWFVAFASRPPLYHEILQLPATEKELESLVRVDVADNLRGGQAVRAGFNGSAVSRNNRLIERHESSYGYYWKSYDFAKNVDQQNLFAHPLGPGAGKDQFKHDGGELIFSLPNGLQGYMLVNAEGGRLDKAPTDIVSDPKRPDRAVENGLSCMTCHVRGILPKDDQVRPHVEKNAKAYAKQELDLILQLYPAQNRLQKLMQEDADRFRKSVEQLGVPIGITEPIANLTGVYEADLDLMLASAEAGLKPDAFQDLLKESSALARTLGSLQVSGGTVQRETFMKQFGLVARAGRLGATPQRPAETAGGSAAKPAPRTGPLIKLTDKATPGWLLKQARVRTPIHADKPYLFAQLPKEIDGGTLLVRSADQNTSWLEPSTLSAQRDCTAYAIIIWKYLGKVQVDEATFAKFEREGWEEVKGEVKTTFPPGEDWRWKAIKKKVEKGDVILQLENITFPPRVHVLYVFKEAS